MTYDLLISDWSSDVCSSDLVMNDIYAHVCLYGEFGKGKTSTVGLYNSDTEFIVTDYGWQVLNTIGISDPNIIKYEGHSQLKHFQPIEGQTYCLDTISEMVEQYLDLLLEHANWKGDLRTPIITKDEELKTAVAPAFADYHVIRNK